DDDRGTTRARRARACARRPPATAGLEGPAAPRRGRRGRPLGRAGLVGREQRGPDRRRLRGRHGADPGHPGDRGGPADGRGPPRRADGPLRPRGGRAAGRGGRPADGRPGRARAGGRSRRGRGPRGACRRGARVDRPLRPHRGRRGGGRVARPRGGRRRTRRRPRGRDRGTAAARERRDRRGGGRGERDARRRGTGDGPPARRGRRPARRARGGRGRRDARARAGGERGVSGATTTTTVLCAVRGAREADVVTTLGAPGLQVTRRCADVVELLAAAAAGAGPGAVGSDDRPGLDRGRRPDLPAHGGRVVALAADGTWEEGRLRAHGVDAVVDLDLPGDALRDAVRAVVPTTDPEARPGAPAPAPEHGGDREEPARRGIVVAVWGPTGAPGRTTLATNLAAELTGTAPEPRARRARRRRTPGPGAASPAEQVLLVDADTYGGTVAQRLGLLDESPGLAAAARGAAQGTLDAARLAALAPAVLPGLRVLTGLTRAARWPELPGSSLDAVWETARSVVDWTVVDTGFAIERDEML